MIIWQSPSAPMLASSIADLADASLRYEHELERLFTAPLAELDAALRRVPASIYHGEHRARARLAARVVRELVADEPAARACFRALFSLHPRVADDARTRLFEWLLVTLLGAARNDPAPLERPQLVLVICAFLELVWGGARVADRALFTDAGTRFTGRHHVHGRELVLLHWCFAAAVGDPERAPRAGGVTGAAFAEMITALQVRTPHALEALVRENCGRAGTSIADDEAAIQIALSASLEDDREFRARQEQARIKKNYDEALRARSALSSSAAAVTDYCWDDDDE